MDIELDSNLGEIEEVETVEHAGGTLQTYSYEPVSRNQYESSADSEPTQICLSSFPVSKITNGCTRCFLY